MANGEAAVMALVLANAFGVLLADGERQRVRWICAMRRCLLRMNGIIRYEQPPLVQLLERIDLRTTQQERQLTRLLHACAADIHDGRQELQWAYAKESAKLAGYGVLSSEDRAPFETVLCELGRTRLNEQVRLIDGAEERMRFREEELSRNWRKRAHLIRMMGFASGAALFMVLV